MPRRPRVQVVSKKDVGDRLRSLRSQRRLTQIELAQILDSTQSHVSGLERGSRSLTIHQVVRLATALRTSTDALLLGENKGTAHNGHLPERRFLRRLQQIDKLSKRDQQSLLGTIDAFLSKLRV